jgi:hypothetical protein
MTCQVAKFSEFQFFIHPYAFENCRGNHGEVDYAQNQFDAEPKQHTTGPA